MAPSYLLLNPNTEISLYSENKVDTITIAVYISKGIKIVLGISKLNSLL
jgi:hypothetical protein